MNPFKEKAKPADRYFMDWKKIYPIPYDKNEVDPYTKTRIILMNGTEYEAVWFSHRFHRDCADNDLRRELAVLRRTEQQQQKRIACLKPIEETMLEHTIGYEQLAVDLTAILAQREPDPYVVEVMNLALLEDFDHLYRYADLLDFERGIHAERLVGSYTEIMPGRPTISEHRHPRDSVRCPGKKDAAPITKLNTAIITAAEQQTMNYYMSICGLYDSDLGRRLYQEIGMIEEQHVTQYGALVDPNCTWLENLLMHEYTECYLYYSCFEDECDPYVKEIWEQHFEQEVSHLHTAAALLKKYEGREACEIIPDGTFPELLKFSPQKAYVRKVLAGTVTNTANREDVVPLATLPDDADYYKYQKAVNTDLERVASHQVIEEEIGKNGKDYRAADKESPVEALRDREKDNIDLGRVVG